VANAHSDHWSVFILCSAVTAVAMPTWSYLQKTQPSGLCWVLFFKLNPGF